MKYLQNDKSKLRSDNNGRENGTLNLSENSVPTGVDGLTALDSLRQKDWDVTVDTV